MNVAVTDFAASMLNVTVGDAPEAAPVQPVKIEFASGVAVSVTIDPPSKVALHTEPQ